MVPRDAWDWDKVPEHLRPTYRVVDEQGPDHAKTFVVEVTVSGRAYGKGEGRSKKDAEQLAARVALEALSAELGPDGQPA